jgi:hypothetical protein
MEKKNNNVPSNGSVPNKNAGLKYSVQSNSSNTKNAGSPVNKKDIEVAAYYNWLKRGRPMWEPKADWLAAEKQFKG